MIDWVSIVRHSRRRFSNYVGSRSPVRIRKRRRAPPPHVLKENQYNCCCSNQNQRFKVEGESELPKTDGHYQQSPPQPHSPEPTTNNVQQAPVESLHSEQAVSADIPQN